jgi:hypothetical protein
MLAAALFALALAQEALPTAPSETPPPQPATPAPGTSPAVPPGDLTTAPPLPTGPLLTVARDARGETFLVRDRAALTGITADFWTYEAFTPPIEVRPGAKVVQGLAHHEVDCAARTDRTVASAGYDEDGVAIVALAASPSAPLAAGSAYDLIAGKLCSGAALPTAGDVLGYKAALAAARSLPSG